MFNDVVVFNQKMDGIFISNKMFDFFSNYEINYLNSDFFPMDKLRCLYKEDKTLFYYIVNELSLIGCDFYSKISNNIFPPIIGKDFSRLSSSDDSKFTAEEVTRFGLEKVFLKYERHTKRSLNGVSIERLNRFLKSDVCSVLFNNGFSQRTNTFDIQKEEMENLENIEEIKNICVPKFYLKFVTCFWVCSPELIQSYRELGIEKYKELIRLKKEECEKYVTTIKKNVSNIYLQGKYITDLCTFLQEKDEFHALINQYDITFDYFFNDEIDFKSDKFYPIKNFMMFSLNDTNYSIDFFIRDKAKFNSICIPCSAADYLREFKINGLISLKKSIFDKQLGFIRLANYEDHLCVSEYNPFIVLENIEAEINSSFVANEERLDREYRKPLNSLFFKTFRKRVSMKFKNREKMNTVYDIVSRRDKGETLQSIAIDYKITRERIRQIILRFLKLTAISYTNFINSAFESMCYLPISECLKICGLIQFLESEINKTKYVIAYDLGVVLEKTKYTEIKTFMEKNQYEIGFDIFNSNIDLEHQPFNFAGCLLMENKITTYNPFPIFNSIKKNLILEITNLYLDSKGIKGFDANKDLDEARNYYAKYDTNDLKASDRVIISRIQRCDVVLVGMSTYAKSKFITSDMLSTAEKVIKEYKINKDFGTVAKDIYNANKALLSNAGVDNYYFLYGLASKYDMCGYIYSGRSMRIFIEKEKTFEEIIHLYMKKYGPIVVSKRISNDLGVREVAFEQVNIITKFDSNTFIECSEISCTEDQKDKLFNRIENKIMEDDYCLTDDILNSPLYFDEKFNTFFKKNMLNTATRLAYALDVIIKRFKLTKYVISHWINCISYMNNPILTTPDVVYNHFKGNSFSKSDLDDYLDSINLAGKITRLDFLKNYVVRVGNDNYVCSKEYNVDPKEMESILYILNTVAKDDYFLTANEVLIKLKIKSVKHSFANNPIGLCSALSFYSHSNRTRPLNNLGCDNSAISTLLINKNFFNDFNIKELIIKFVLKEEKTYLSYNEINEVLMANEIISFALPYDVYKNVFNRYLDENGLVNTKK